MKSVVIYTYFMSPSSDYNLSFFVKKEVKYRKDIDYIVVINGHKYADSIVFPKISNLKVLKRNNIGVDFGGYNSALKYIENKNETYDYYFFMNSGVIGPIIPHYYKQHWSNIFIKKINNLVKLVGTTIVCLPHNDDGGYGPKVEGFFFMVDSVGLSILKKEKTIFYNHPDKYSAVVKGEYGLSKCILENGYSIDCMLPKYQNIDWRNPKNYDLNNNIHPSRTNSYFGTSINPFDVIFHKWYWSYNNDKVNFNIIDEYVKLNS